MPKVSVIVGTRPELVKTASILRLLAKGDPADFEFIHTEQHYDERMSDVFLRELNLPSPTTRLRVGSGSHAAQTATAIARIATHLESSRPDVVVVQGDTNTVLAGAVAAAKMGIAVAHVEAGLRSHDLRMPEELNRRMVDHASRFLYAPTKMSGDRLRDEHVWGEVVVTGNTALDAIELFVDLAKGHAPPGIPASGFALVTMHRAENVDDPSVLAGIVDALLQLGVPVVFPVHPRTRARLEAGGLLEKLSRAREITLLPPVGYLEFLDLLARCRFVVTDSGGIQEEVTAPSLRKHVFVVRTSTERPEAVDAGFATLVGVRPADVLRLVTEHVEAGCPRPHRPSPYGDGKAGERILAHLADALTPRG